MLGTVSTINDVGIEEIREFLAANHKRGAEHFTPDMLKAWAAEAEFQLAEGNEATIELKASESIHGHTQEFRISGAGIDTTPVEIDDCDSPGPRDC